MNLWRCTMYIRQRNSGWSEVYVMDADKILPTAQDNPLNNSSNGQSVMAVFLDLCKKRAPLLGAEANIYSARVSNIGGSANNRLASKAWPELLSLSGYPNAMADDPPTDLVVLGYNSDGTRHKVTHMRGIWQGINCNGGVFTPTGLNNNLSLWTAFWNAYKTQLTQTAGLYGWIGASNSAPTQVVDVTQNIDNTITITVADAGYFTNTMIAAKKWPATIRGVEGCPNINGQMLLVPKTGTTANSYRAISVFPYTRNGQLRAYLYTFIPFTTMRPYRLGNAKPGRITPDFRGRRKGRVLG